MLVQKRNKIRLFLYGSMLMAIVLGVYAQDITYLLYDNLDIPLMIGLSIPTILSIILFFSPSILIPKLDKENIVSEKEFNIYFSINIITATIISSFSFIVWIAWCS